MTRRLNVVVSADPPKLLTESLQAHGTVDGIVPMFAIFVARVVDEIGPLRLPFVDQPQVPQHRLGSTMSARRPDIMSGGVHSG